MFPKQPREVPCVVMLLCAVLTVGCGGGSPAPQSTASESRQPAASHAPPAIPDLSTALAKPHDKPEGERTPPSQDVAGEPVADSGASEAGETAEPSAAAPAVEEERQVAVAGVGRKGKGYGGGIISTPVSAYFGARERIAFIAVTDAMRKFQALHDRNPESHKEFMEQIINENGI